MSSPHREEAMPGPGSQSAPRARSARSADAHLRKRWAEAYGELLASQLEPSRRYSIVRIGTAQFAYTRYDQLVEALGRAWALGFVPESHRSVLGRDLPDAAPDLRGVDSDLTELNRPELPAPPEPD